MRVCRPRLRVLRCRPGLEVPLLGRCVCPQVWPCWVECLCLCRSVSLTQARSVCVSSVGPSVGAAPKKGDSLITFHILKNSPMEQNHFVKRNLPGLQEPGLLAGLAVSCLAPWACVPLSEGCACSRGQGRHESLPALPRPSRTSRRACMRRSSGRSSTRRAPR